jgi:hypothetical protein
MVLHGLVEGHSYAVEGETQTLGPDSVHLSLVSGNLHRGFGDPFTPRLRVTILLT